MFIWKSVFHDHSTIKIYLIWNPHTLKTHYNSCIVIITLSSCINGALGIVQWNNICNFNALSSSLNLILGAKKSNEIIARIKIVMHTFIIRLITSDYYGSTLMKRTDSLIAVTGTHIVKVIVNGIIPFFLLKIFCLFGFFFLFVFLFFCSARTSRRGCNCSKT